MLQERGVEIVESHVVREGAELRRRVQRAVDRKAPLILVAGGDGSMTSVVGSFAHTESVLGVLPFGTGNSFAQSVGISPPTLERAVEAIVDGHAAAVDLGVIDGSYFANFATVGLSSEIARNTPTALKKLLGPLAYVVAGIGPTLRSQAFDATLKWDGGKAKVCTHQLIVANGRYYGHVPVLPDATIVDGTLAVFTTSGLSRWDVVRAFVAFFFGRQTDLSEAEYFTATEITIKTKPKQAVDIDGESHGSTPVRFGVAPKALRVMVPPDFTGT